MGPKAAELIAFLEKRSGMATYSAILQAGFHKATLGSLTATGKIERAARALYRLPDAPPLSDPDLVTTALRVPRGVVCLLSALSFHGATDEVPRHVDLAIPKKTHANKIDYPPIRFYRFAPEAWKAGIQEHKIDGCSVRVYSLAKTVADCFKFRNRVGPEVARIALKIAVAEKGVPAREIMRYAKICRVHKIIKPILESYL